MSESLGSRGVYSIGAVSRMVEVPVATLRAWEERYGVVQPQRSEGGQRLFSRDQVEHLRFVKERIDEGFSPSEAHRLLEERIVGMPGPRPRTGSRRLLILLAERDPYAAELAEYFLRTEGYDVALAFEVEESRRAFRTIEPDLVVLEWLISGGAGEELVRDLREQGDRPILVLSPLALRDAALDAGADAFLQKPLDPLLFVSTVKDLLGESALIRPAGARPRVQVRVT